MQGIQQKDKDDPVVLCVGTQVSAKYKGAFCEAKIHTVSKDVKVRITHKKGGQQTVSDDLIIGEVRVGNTIEIKSTDSKTENSEATITKIQDCSKYTVVFDDGDIATLRRSALCRQSGKHFNACDTLDQLPLTHPEQRGGGRKNKTQDEYESDDDEYAIGKVVCVENTDTKKKNARESYFPALVVAPKAQENVKIHIKSEYLVRSFKDGRYYTVPKKEVNEFTKETEQKSDIAAVAAAREFLDKNVLPTHWDREVLIDSASLSDQELSDSSDDEPNEVKDRFFAQLLEFMEKRNSPLNKGPSITNRDVDLYRLYYSVEKLGGYANVTKIRNWKAIAKRLGFTPTDAIVKLVKHSYRKFLLAFEEAVTKGIEELPPRTNRGKARSSSTRSGSVASPKVVESKPSKKFEKPTTSSAADDSENTSESTKVSSFRKLSNASSKTKSSPIAVEKMEKIEKVEKIEKEDKIKIEKIEKVEVIEKEEKVKFVVEKEKSVSKDEDTPSTSPIPSVSSVKKDKPLKKKPPETKKIITKKEKEEPIEKKEIAMSKSQAPSGPSIADDVLIAIDDRLKVYYRGSSDYEAKVLEISERDGKPVYRVHYKGWNARYDEWIHRESIAENLTKDEGKKKSFSSSKTPSSSSSSTNIPSTPSAAAQKGMRARNRADTTASSRSTTPLSNTSSKTKVNTNKRPTRGTPTSKNRTSLVDDNSSESDEPIKKPSEKKEKGDEKVTQKSSEMSDAKTNPKDNKGESKSTIEKPSHDSLKSDDEKSTKSSIKSGKSPFEKGKLKPIQRDSSRSSFHSTDSDSSHSVPSDVPNSSKSAYTSENESNEPDKIVVKPSTTTTTTDVKKSSFKFDEETSDIKNLSSFFGDNNKPLAPDKPTVVEIKPEIFVVKKPTNIFQEKKAAAAAQKAIDTPKVGRFGQQLEKSLAKDANKSTAKSKNIKVEEKSAESDIYEFIDTEEAMPSSSVVKKQESPIESQTKKQQLAQQRKQARAAAAAVQKEEPAQMEDIESMIKTSIVSFPSNKKQKKSSPKEEKVQQQSSIVARTTTSSSAATSSVQSQQASVIMTNTPSASSAWDIYSKSTGGQQPTSSTNRSATTTPKRSESTFDVLRKSPSFNMHHMDDFSSSTPTTTSPSSAASGKNFPTTAASGPVKFGTLSQSELETHELLKPIMMPSKEEEKPELEAFKKILDPSFDILPKQEKQTTSIADKLLKAISQVESGVFDIKKDEPLVKIEPYKATASSTLSDSKTIKKIDLDQQVVAPLESAITSTSSSTAAAAIDSSISIKKSSYDSDTDSETERLIMDVVEVVNEKKKMGVLESIMMQDEISYKHSGNAKESEKKTSESGEQQSETMSLLLCEETIPGSPAPVKDPLRSDDPLSEIGRSPTSSSGNFVQPQSMAQSGSGYTMKYSAMHQQYQVSQGNSKSNPMDIEGDVEAATGDILRDKLKSATADRGSATSSGNNTNNNSDNSNDDDQSENEKNLKSDITPRKKKRSLKVSEPDSHQKRRRHQRTGINVRGNLQGNDSDSNDNSDVNTFARAQMETTEGSNKIKFNFLVELDSNMPCTQRINVLEKKIQDLRKTYLMIKNEMNAKERRRKKLRKRERENKQKQTAKVA